MNQDFLATLEARQVVRERPFRSDVPLIGRLIAWFRAQWNNVATRWYVLPLLQQQNEFNALVTGHLRHLEQLEIERRLVELEQRTDETGEWFIGLDRDQTLLARNVAELTYQVVRMNRLLASIEARLPGPDSDPQEV